jgi:hypothetical protein
MANFLQKLFGLSSTQVSQQDQPAQPSEPISSSDDVLTEANRLMLLMEVMTQAKRYRDDATVQAVSNMTYDGPLPEKLPDGSYSRIYELQDYNIAGINYRENIAAYIGDFEGYLKPDPDNEHDPNAISVHAEDGHHLGFIPAACTDYIRALGKPFPIAVTGTIDQEHDDIEDRYYFVGTVYLYVLKK